MSGVSSARKFVFSEIGNDRYSEAEMRALKLIERELTL